MNSETVKELDKKEKRMIDAIKIVKQSYLQYVFIHLQLFI